jgi:glutamate-1-semialdehyde aminotransferase
MQLMAEAKTLLPGGVNSPVRAFRSVGGNPIVFDRVKGAYAFDVDGNKYIDYVGSWGPAICGHANDEVRTLTQLRHCGGEGRDGCWPALPLMTHSFQLCLRQVNAALVKALEKGTSFGAPCALEVRACP